MRILGPVLCGVALAGVLGVQAHAAAARDPGTTADAPLVGLADDGYHYAEWADGRQDALYTEWWYFNLQDPRTGVRAIFSYFVEDPSDLAGLARVQLVAVAYTDQGIVTATDGYPADAFSASTQRADVTIGPAAPVPNIVRVAADGSYRVVGASRDGRLAWDLTYVSESEPWLAADRMQVGSLSWERMSWLVFMPRARVVGTLTVDDQVIPVDGPGYHDHNWGEWIPTDALWNWAQFSSPRLALEVGDFMGRPVGRVSLDVDGVRTVFEPGQYSLSLLRWAWDAVNRVFYPVESRLLAENGSVRLAVTLRELDTAPLRGNLPQPLPDLIIYEQTARYEGLVWERSAAGAWRVRAVLLGTGFKEYTGRQR